MAAKGSCISSVHRNGRLQLLKWAWTADASGDVDENASGNIGFFCKRVFGFIVGFKVKYISAATGYDVTILDEQGMDVLKGLGADLVNSGADVKNRGCPVNKSQDLATSNFAGSLICLWNADLEIIVANADNGTKGEIELYVLLPERWDSYGLRA